MTKKTVIQPEDKYVIRFPDGMRDRIKRAAERSGRSMNAEIIAALEHFYPPEPSIEEVLDRVHEAIDLARNAQSLPYRKVLIDALDQLSEQVSSGMEPDQFRKPHIGSEYQNAGLAMQRLRRWQRAQKDGVETQDVERELSRGMFSRLPGSRVRQFLQFFNDGRGDLVLQNLGMGQTKFADREKVLELLREHLDRFYRDNWGDPQDRPPWEDEDF